jgi:uncharacterized membrane protein
MKKNSFFNLNFVFLAILLAFHFLNIAHGLIYNNPSAVSFITSLQFILGMFVLTPLFIFMFTALVKKYGIKQGEKQDRIFFYALIVLLILDFILSFQRTINRVSFGLYNFTLFGAIAAVYYRLNTFKNGIAKSEEKQLFKIILITAGVLTVFFGVFNVSLHNAFFTSSDMGIFTNAVWRINHDGTQNTFIEDYKDHTGVHLQPVLYLLSLFFRLGCSPYILIFLQVIFVFFAAVFLFLLAEKITRNKTVSYLMALSFLVSAYTFRTISYDYHPETMYMLMFFAFLYFAEAKNFIASAVFLGLAVIMKEEAPVYMACAAVFAFLRTKDKKYIILALCSLIYAYAAIKMIMPAHNSGNSSWLSLIKMNLTDFDLNYLKTNFFLQFFIFLAAAAFLPLFELRSFLLVFLPAIGLHLARYDRGFQFLFDLHYAAFVVPPLFAAALYGVDRARVRWKLTETNFIFIAFVVFLMQAQVHLSFIFKFSAGYVSTVILTALFLLYTAFAAGKNKAKMNFSILAVLVFIIPYAGFYSFYREKLTYIKQEHKDSIYRALARLPEDENTAVMTNINIVPHVCCRKYVWQIEWGSAASVLLPVIKEKLKEFYMLVYLYDYSYTQEKLLPSVRNKEIHDLALKMGYKFEFVYGDDIAGLVRYSKE